MIITSYNPSPLEIALAEIFPHLKEIINNKLDEFKVDSIERITDKDNPRVVLHMSDKDNDKHEVVIKIIQRPDKPLQVI